MTAKCVDAHPRPASRTVFPDLNLDSRRLNLDLIEGRAGNR